MSGHAEPAAQVEGPPDAVVDPLIEIAAAEFGPLGFLAPDGVLDLAIGMTGVQAVRIEALGGRPLRLQSIGIDTGAAEPVTFRVSVTSGQGDPDETVDTRALLDFDRPTGTLIDTPAGHPGAVELGFAGPATIQRLRLRNANDAAIKGARGVRIFVKSRWRRRLVVDMDDLTRRWRTRLDRATTAAASDPDTLALLGVLDLTVRGDYGRAHRSLASKVQDPSRRLAFRAAVNRSLLPARGLEWTVHGPQRPFRSWSEAERIDYVQDSSGVVEALRSLTPDVCLGFGSVLAVVRDRALIPHDDDLDIIIGFTPELAPTLADGLRLVEAHLRPLGFIVSGPFAAHRHVRRPGRKHVDVFVGIFEGETISWYPGARGGLTRAIVFPPQPAELLGIGCSIPAQPEIYLERLYGPDWRIPDPYFSHAWDLSGYADIKGDANSASGPPGGSAVTSTEAR